MKKAILWFSVIVAIITLVAAFTITGCKKTTVTETVAVTAVASTVSETTSPATTAVETTSPATTGMEDLLEASRTSIKNDVMYVIATTYNGEMTKFDINDDFSLMTVSYDTKQSSEDKIKKEMYNIISDFSGVGIVFDLTATNDSGDVYHSHNTIEILNKIKNLEMDYSEWLKETISEETTAAETTASETTEKTTETTAPKQQTLSKSAYLKSILNLIGEYNSAVNHMNTYQDNYDTLDGLAAFMRTFLAKLAELNGRLKSLNPPSSMTANQTHFIDLANTMYSYIEQLINYLENGDVNGYNQVLTNFNNTHAEFDQYYNSLI
jgi:hypothetical protein